MLQDTLHHVISRYRTVKSAVKLALTALLFSIPFTASHACSVHDHGCIYHGFNATVNTSYPTTNTDTSVVLYSIGKTPNTGTSSNVDFDNKVWIPELTGAKDANGNYTTPTGAYILNNTAYGTSHPPADTYVLDDRYRLVYPSQYQITFNQNSAVAKHTGDFNGAENGNIPNATGCPNMPNAANCEAVVVTGNVPTGFYDQQVRIFNSTGNPNPAVDLQVGVYTTGKARLVTPSHIDNGNETADFQSISGTGATTPLYRYEIVNTGYDPHAGGVAWFDRNRTYTTGYGKPYIAGSHIYQSRFDTTDTTRTNIYKYGAGEQSLQARNFSTKHLYLGEVAPPPPPPVARKGVDWGDCKPLAPCTQQVNLNSLNYDFDKSAADKYIATLPAVPKYSLNVTTYKKELGLLGYQYVIDHTDNVTVSSKSELLRLLAIEAENGRVASEQNDKVVGRGETAYNAAGYVPVLGEGFSAGEAIFGIDPTSGQTLSNGGRIISALGAIPIIGKASRTIKAAEDFSEQIAKQQLKEAAEKQAKEQAEKKAREIAEKEAKENAEKKAKEEAEKRAKKEAEKQSAMNEYTVLATVLAASHSHPSGNYSVRSELELTALFLILTKGGKLTNGYPGAAAYELPDKTHIQLRQNSNSGGATIDIKPRGNGNKMYKIHIGIKE